MTMTNRESELIELLKNSDLECNYMWRDSPFGTEEHCDHTLKLQNLGVNDVELVDKQGGENKGSDYYSIYEFKFDDGESIFVKFDGWYASYVGAEFEESFIVYPKQVLVTQYFDTRD